METTTETGVGEGGYENPWTYKGSTFTSVDIDGQFGFVYRITNLQTGKQYIGRKYFIQRRKPRGGKRKVSSESDWKKYYGSSPELAEDVKKYGRNIFKREILSIHSTAGRVNFEETRQLFLNNVLTESLTDGTPAYYNSNILGRYYRKDYFESET
tara:strand:- start:149 stop:613 length:465 start_codon:yes stop_codon:yes gene_type:complete